MNLLPCVLAVALAACAVSAGAGILECTDANGKKTFAEKCPADTAKQRELNPGGTSPLNASTPSSSGKSPAELEAGFRKRQMEREQTEAREKAAKQKAARDCNIARQRLFTLQNGRRLRTTDPNTGEVRFLDDNERVSQTENERAEVEKLCN